MSTWTELTAPMRILHVEVEHGAGEVGLLLDGDAFTAPLRVPDARLWSPDDPHLRTLVVTLARDGAPVDEVTLQIGLRTVAVEGDRILLNGEPLVLRGFGRHEDFPVLGRGASAAVAARDLQLMRDLGANSFRTGHYPHDEDTLDLADRLGLLVISETPSVALFFAEEGSREAGARAQLRRRARRPRPEPRLRVAWSVANEPHPRDAAAGALLVELCDRARASTRPGWSPTRATRPTIPASAASTSSR